MATRDWRLSSIFTPCPEHAAYRSVSGMVEISNNSDDSPDTHQRPLFPHPPWMVGIVLIFGVLAILAGFSDPIWFFLGLPCIIVLILYIYVRISRRTTREE
jgi:hypothetical protein